MGYHQEALINCSATQELARICGLTPEEVLDVVLSGWRDISDGCYAESITWGQVFKLSDELDKCKEPK